MATVQIPIFAPLLPDRGVEVSGSAEFERTDLLGLSQREIERRRGRDLGMVFQTR